jgi:tetratricopeptide (TPR) repeat protein
MTLPRLVTRLLISATFIASSCGYAADPEATFRRAITFLESQKYAEAVPLLKELFAAYPNSQGVLWNLGIAAAEINDDTLALDAWNRYRKNFPQDARALPKLVQTYQSLGWLVDRDREREALFSFRNSLPLNERDAFPQFCREQFRVKGVKVMAFEVFEPTGSNRLYYRFSILDTAGKETAFFSLGSYDSTTQIARELGEIAADGRAYHLDRYAVGTHATYGHFNGLPSYEVVRQLVVDALLGKSHPMSESRYDQK